MSIASDVCMSMNERFDFARPRRPFRHLVEFMLLGRKPRGRSFPSGHAAASFAGGWILGTVWPRHRPQFLGLATLVSLSRIYLGAHYPGDIASGAVVGVFLAELVRRIGSRLFG